MKISKGTRVRLNERYKKQNGDQISPRSIWQVGTEATVVRPVGRSVDLYTLVADGHPTGAVFHRNFFDVVG